MKYVYSIDFVLNSIFTLYSTHVLIKTYKKRLFEQFSRQFVRVPKYQSYEVHDVNFSSIFLFQGCIVQIVVITVMKNV